MNVEHRPHASSSNTPNKAHGTFLQNPRVETQHSMRTHSAWAEFVSSISIHLVQRISLFNSGSGPQGLCPEKLSTVMGFWMVKWLRRKRKVQISKWPNSVMLAVCSWQFCLRWQGSHTVQNWFLTNHTTTFWDLWSRKELCGWTGIFFFFSVRTHFHHDARTYRFCDLKVVLHIDRAGVILGFQWKLIVCVTELRKWGRDNHPIPDHPTFFDKFQPNEKNSSFYLIPNFFSHILVQCLNFILTQEPKMSGFLCLTEIGGPPKRTTRADHFSQITQYRTATGPLPDHLRPETSTETWFESCKYFLFLLKNQTLLFKKIIISGGPLAWCWNTVGLEKWSFFPLFHFCKKWKFTIFVMKIFYEHIIQKIWNFVKLYFVLLLKKTCSLDA